MVGFVGRAGCGGIRDWMRRGDGDSALCWVSGEDWICGVYGGVEMVEIMRWNDLERGLRAFLCGVIYTVVVMYTVVVERSFFSLPNFHVLPRASWIGLLFPLHGIPLICGWIQTCTLSECMCSSFRRNFHLALHPSPSSTFLGFFRTTPSASLPASCFCPLPA